MTDFKEQNKIDDMILKASSYIEANGGVRLLWGIGLILSLQVFFVLGWIGKTTDDREIALAAIEAEVKTNRALVSDDKIADRLEQTKTTVEEFRDRTYEASTIGLISAEIEAFLRKGAENAGLDRVQVTLNFEKTDRKDVVRFVADISAQEQNVGDFSLYLSEILTSKKAHSVSAIAWHKRIKRLNLTVECVGRLIEVES